MCGITGFKLFNQKSSLLKEELRKAILSLNKRGPDSSDTYFHNQIGLGHTRLSIIDTSVNGNQPMTDPSGRYTLIFNGEIYNYKELSLSLDGINLRSRCDTEVLLHLLILKGSDCLNKLNGFFSLAFYDTEKDILLIARDKMGIKPMLFYRDENQFVFGSEMKALLHFVCPKKINKDALYWYLKLNYIPSNLSMLDGVEKLSPGHFIEINKNTIKQHKFEEVDTTTETTNYTKAKIQLVDKLEQAVKLRLVADVPVGSFLSGGTDSSAIVALASRHHPHLNTFSIGYKNHPFFDETRYAELVAKKFNTTHQTFSLTNDDLLNDLDSIINYIDEPFADSSSIPTYILSKHVSKHIKVALSGDGADELFGGYYKHLALNKSLSPSFSNHLLKGSYPLIRKFPQSRSNTLSNLFRRVNRYGKALKLDDFERYWFLSSMTDDPRSYLNYDVNLTNISELKNKILADKPKLNSYLDADISMLLPGDMLFKVDLMSMANSLEVRVPFLDKEVVKFARSLPSDFKVQGNYRKRILQDAFEKILPSELHNRSKKGFEVPLLHWMRNELLSDLDATLFNKDRLQEQGLFQSSNVMILRSMLLSNNPGDVHGIIWALYIFQKWYYNYFTK